MRAAFALMVLWTLVLVGCGGGGGGGSKSSEILRVNASRETVTPNGNVTFTAILRGGGRVLWSVDGGNANGTITTGGVYTAPPTQGTYTVRATSASDSAVTQSASIVVTNGISIALTSPTTVPLTIPRSKLTFAAAVTGATDKTIEWTVSPNTASINSSGVFTAPDTLGTYTVTARSRADNTKSATATVQVVANVNVRFNFSGRGAVVFGLRPDKAPNTCANLVTLVNQAFYNDIIVHRYVYEEDDMVSMTDELRIVQWGDPLTKTLPLSDSSIGTGGPGYTIDFEANDLVHDQYALAMARATGMDTAGSQVYVALDAQHVLDGNYVVFGSVTTGQDVITAVRRGDRINSARVEAIP